MEIPLISCMHIRKWQQRIPRFLQEISSHLWGHHGVRLVNSYVASHIDVWFNREPHKSINLCNTYHLIHAFDISNVWLNSLYVSVPVEITYIHMNSYTCHPRIVYLILHMLIKSFESLQWTSTTIPSPHHAFPPLTSATYNMSHTTRNVAVKQDWPEAWFSDEYWLRIDRKYVWSVTAARVICPFQWMQFTAAY